MSRATPMAVAALATLAVLSLRCDDAHDPHATDGDADVDGDSDADDEDEDADRDGDVGDLDADSDADADEGGVPSGPGPVTVLVQRTAIVTDRLCDLDGDGSLDNAIADLGTSAGEMIAVALTAALQAQLDQTGRIVIHLPAVEDRATVHDLETVAMIFDGVDVDDPPDPSDDWSGEEPFYAEPGYLDGCGEPRYYYPAARLDHGEFRGEGGEVVLGLSGFAPVYVPEITGTISPGGLGAEFGLCARAAISDVGASPGFEGSDDRSMLELMLAGGAAMGFPTLPGVDPDVDLDGDGLEGFILDDEGRIVSCIDGDHTVIEGRECWSDPRMADAFALTIHITCVSACCAGPEPGWESRVEGTCTDPPAQSLWGDSSTDS